MSKKGVKAIDRYCVSGFQSLVIHEGVLGELSAAGSDVNEALQPLAMVGTRSADDDPELIRRVRGTSVLNQKQAGDARPLWGGSRIDMRIGQGALLDCLAKSMPCLSGRANC